MKNKKPKKNKKKEDKKEDTLTKILILVIFVILVFYVPDLWKTFDIPLTVKRIPWRLSANDNLEANLHALAGEEYLFVKGYLRSSCTRFQEQDHCPFKIIEAKPSIYYEEPLLFYKLSVPIRYRLMNRTAENITLELDDVSFISFVKKGNNKIRFLIQDYITNLGLCRKKGLHVNGTICPINWAKKFRIDNITRKRKDISVEITRFDIEQKNTSAEAHIQGRIKGNLTNPLLEVMVYSHAERNPTRLKKRELIELTPKGDYYVFNIKVIMLTPRLSIGYLSPDEEEEFVEQTKEKQDSNIILLLFQDQNYFYAQERIIQEGEITEKIYK